MDINNHSSTFLICIVIIHTCNVYIGTSEVTHVMFARYGVRWPRVFVDIVPICISGDDLMINIIYTYLLSVFISSLMIKL